MNRNQVLTAALLAVAIGAGTAEGFNENNTCSPFARQCVYDEACSRRPDGRGMRCCDETHFCCSWEMIQGVVVGSFAIDCRYDDSFDTWGAVCTPPDRLSCSCNNPGNTCPDGVTINCSCPSNVTVSCSCLPGNTARCNCISGGPTFIWNFPTPAPDLCEVNPCRTDKGCIAVCSSEAPQCNLITAGSGFLDVAPQPQYTCVNPNPPPDTGPQICPAPPPAN